jgi:hypothetical protein
VCLCGCACAHVALLTQHANRMRCIILSTLSDSNIFFDIISKKERFSEKVVAHKMCGFIFSTNLFATFRILRIIQGDVVIHIHTPSCKVPVFLARFCVLYFPHIFAKTQISNFLKIFPVGAKLFYADGRADRHDEANSRFSQFCESA